MSWGEVSLGVGKGGNRGTEGVLLESGCGNRGCIDCTKGQGQDGCCLDNGERVIDRERAREREIVRYLWPTQQIVTNKQFRISLQKTSQFFLAFGVGVFITHFHAQLFQTGIVSRPKISDFEVVSWVHT